MQKQINLSISIVAVILLALTVCGSIWDFEIANAAFKVHFVVAYPLGSAILFIAAYFGYKTMIMFFVS